MIKLQVIGNLGKDAKKKETTSGKPFIEFSVAHTEKYRDGEGNQKEKTIWVNCTWWTEKSGILPYLTKGATIYTEGQPDVRAYTPNGADVPKAVQTLRVSMVQLLGNRNESHPDTRNEPTPVAAADIAEPIDDLPF